MKDPEISVSKAVSIMKGEKRKKIKESEQAYWEFLFFLSTKLKSGTVDAYDFSCQVKRWSLNLRYGSDNRTKEVIDHPLVKNPIFESLQDFKCGITDIIRKNFPKKFAQRVIVYL